MSLNNSQLHGVAFAGTIVLIGSLFGAGAYLASAAPAPEHVPPLKEMITIEASLARKADKPTQPQKPMAPPEPAAKPEGVSHDADKKPPDEPKKDEPKRTAKPDEKPIDISKFRRPTDDDMQTGTPTPEAGTFDGSTKGFAAFNSGHPFWANLKADIIQNWAIPQISNVTGVTVGCLHLSPEGKIVELKFEHSGDEILDDSVQRAVKATQRIRNDKPQPVPIEQLRTIKEWVCLRFNPNQQ